jgi:ABC-type dipeptide/oligopeptide/nickel transport system permease component
VILKPVCSRAHPAQHHVRRTDGDAPRDGRRPHAHGGHAVARVIVRKLAAVIPVLLAVSFLTFLMMDVLPGCLECQILGPDAMDEQSVAAVREDLRLDDPLPVRYAAWLGDAVTGDLGQSYYTRQEVTDAIVESRCTSRHA